MSNGYFNGQTRTSLKGGKVKDTAQPGGGSMPFKEKPGFPGGLPGKAQPKDRSGGVKRVLPHPKSDGL